MTAHHCQSESIRPAKKDAAGGIPRPHSDQQYKIAFLEAPLRDGIAETKRNCARGCISKFVDVDHYFVIGDAKTFLHGANNA